MADASSGSAPRRRRRSRKARNRPVPADDCLPHAPNILVISSTRCAFRAGSRREARARPAAEPRAAARGGRLVRRHYTASNDCTPSRSSLLTGLYTHQTGCLLTGGSTLYPGFPTWGTLLREHGYGTYWFGKWHLTHRDNHWTRATGAEPRRYGFAGGTYPSPNGAPGQGWRVDPMIVDQFERLVRHEGGGGPWCTTVSLVNPHDIAWWYRGAIASPRGVARRAVVARAAAQLRDPRAAGARRKPRLQRSLQDTSARRSARFPSAGRTCGARWLPFLDLYVSSSARSTPRSAGSCATLDRRPEVAANTVIVFTSDHGEYGASHGLRGKGAGAYEEGIHVPLIVKDPRGSLTRAPRSARTAADLERRRRAAAPDDRDRLRRVAPRGSTTRTSPDGSTSSGCWRTRSRPGRPTSCTPPTRS